MDPLNTYKHCIECIRFAYSVIGYENCIKEINFIHHLNNNTLPLQKDLIINKQEPICVKQEPDIVNEINTEQASNTDEPLSENKNIILETPIKYYRTPLTDNIRCTKILETGVRCSFKRDTHSELCSRHKKD